jgi:hypothetical protein
MGTIDQLVEDLQARRERWDISYCVIFEPYPEGHDRRGRNWRDRWSAMVMVRGLPTPRPEADRQGLF